MVTSRGILLWFLSLPSGIYCFYFWADLLLLIHDLLLPCHLEDYLVLGTMTYWKTKLLLHWNSYYPNRISMLRWSLLPLWWITSVSLCSSYIPVITIYHWGYWVHLFLYLSVPSDFCGSMNRFTCPFSVLTALPLLPKKSGLRFPKTYLASYKVKPVTEATYYSYSKCIVDNI